MDFSTFFNLCAVAAWIAQIDRWSDRAPNRTINKIRRIFLIPTSSLTFIFTPICARILHSSSAHRAIDSYSPIVSVNNSPTFYAVFMPVAPISSCRVLSAPRMEAIKEDEVQIYLVGFIDEEMEERSLFGRSPAKKAKDLLMRIAYDSGGRAYFPKDISEVPAIAANIAKDLRVQYVISYYPTNERRDGVFRTIQVSVNQIGGRKLIARARRGYYARNDQGQAPAEAQKKTRDDER